MNIRIVRKLQLFVRSIKDDVSLLYHHHFRIDEAKFVAFFFEEYPPFAVNDSIFGRKIS